MNSRMNFRNRWLQQSLPGTFMLVLLGTLSWPFNDALANDTARQQASALPGPEVKWQIALAGDVIMNRRIAQFDNDQDPFFRDMANIIRTADAAYLNMEQSIFRYSEFKGWPEAEYGGNWDYGPPEVATDLQAIGFSMFGRANNHTTDYGVEGMRLTNQLLDELGIVHAGSGMNLGAASRPGYQDTARGRVALISLATTFTPMSRAANPRPDAPGRPGLNALRVDRKYVLDKKTFRGLQAVSSDIAGRILGAQSGSEVVDRDAPMSLFDGRIIELGSSSGIVDTINPIDQDRILREVRNAADQADYVIVASHTHEPGVNSLDSAPWFSEFARMCIDAGATAVVVTGPHQLRGVEIYQGRPIFHSLGNFVFHNETVDPVAADHYEKYGLPETALVSDLYNARYENGTIGYPAGSVWYESVIAVPQFKGTQLAELRMYPIDLSQTAPRSQRGTPRLATGETATAILNRLTELSAKLGTTLKTEKGVLVWRAQDHKGK